MAGCCYRRRWCRCFRGSKRACPASSLTKGGCIMSKMAVDLSRPIDRKSLSVAPLLEDLQGNILRGHGRDHTVHLFLKLRPEAVSDAKEWIKDFAAQYVTSAKKQFEEMDDFRRFRIIGSLFANFFLTHKGYEILGIPAPQDPKFVAGMKASRADLADPAPEGWEEGYRGEIHAAILLAHDD